MDTILNYFAPANNTIVTESGFRYMNTNPEYKRSETLHAQKDIDLFEQFYKKNNQLRYCNGHYYDFADANVKARYKEWLNSDDYKAKSFNLYYGNGIVD